VPALRCTHGHLTPHICVHLHTSLSSVCSGAQTWGQGEGPLGLWATPLGPVPALPLRSDHLWVTVESLWCFFLGALIQLPENPGSDARSPHRS
jgi:hypothetical protein